MTKLKNTPLKQIIELFNILEPEQYHDPNEFNDPELTEMFTRFVKSSLKNAGYDVPNDYHAMYWFAKGRQRSPLQSPSQSSEKYSSSFQLNDEQQCIKKQNIELLKQLPKHSKSFILDIDKILI